MECSSPGCVQELRRGQHACLLYDKHDDALATVAPFVAAGLAAGERCVYVLGEAEVSRVERSLEAVGIDVARQVQRGALVLVSRWEVSFPGGEFDPAAMIGFVRQTITQTLAEGFSGVRVAAEMTWALQMGVGANKLIHYEALGNHLYPDEPLVAVCMYDRGRFPAAVCQDAMRMHPWVAVGTTAYDNLYYEPPAVVVGSADARLEWMLERLRRVREADAQRQELFSTRVARAEAESAAQAKEALLGMLAHELRTPLTGMLTYAQTALRRLDKAAGQGVDLEALRRSLEGVVYQASRQARLIEQVLDAARLASAQLPLTPVPCDLTALVQTVAEQVQAIAPDHTLVVQASGRAEALVDPGRLEQVLVNLLDNARKYSPPGTRIEVGVVHEPEAITVAVRDHGEGIPAEAQERIFERFHRLRHDQSGLGLGLHISREIIRMHGGDLRVETPADGGARFVARLPARG